MSRFDGPSFVSRARRGAALALALVLGATTAGAQQQEPPRTYIRDAEVEQLLREYLNPLLKVANQPAGAVKLAIVQDRSFNAFISNGRRMTLFTGAIIDAQTPNELIGVMAHETGHISGGHLARLAQEMPKAQAIAILGSLLGVGALVGASRANVGISGTAPGGLLMGGTELAMRSLLAYQRTEEAAADRAAITFLNATRQSGLGMVNTLKRFAEQQMFLASRIDKYLLSHPLATDRIAAIETVAKESPYYEAKDPPALALRHNLARAKLVAFTARQEEVNRRYPASDTSLPARYARAIVAHRFARGSEAQALLDGLIAAQPGNPYFWELKGQNLLEAGQAQAALGPLQKAAGLAPGQPLLRVLLGHALIGTNLPANIDRAIKELTVAIQRDPEVLEAYVYLAQAYEKRGRSAEAELTTAESYFMAGAYPQAQMLAKRAQTKLQPGTPLWRRADEIATHKASNKG